MIRSVLGALGRLVRRTARRPFRYERFGGIAQLGWPRALVFVDRDRARSLGHDDGGALWEEEPPGDQTGDRGPATSSPLDARLSAPLEAHLQLTNRCDAGCPGCYTGATPQGGPGEWGPAEWKRGLDELAARGVFHVALGGGESAKLPWLGEVVRHARARGLVPNLTTSGLLDEAELERLCQLAPLFGQINVSIDGVGERYAQVRGHAQDGFVRADRAVVALRRRTRHVGLNCVLTRQGWDGLGELFAYARRRRLSEIELLRFKPAGRGAATYQLLRCTSEQHEALLPAVLRLSRRHRLRVRLDCSLAPFVAHHQPDPALLRWLSFYGCAGGDHLVGARAHGGLTACSFAPAPPGGVTVDKLGAYWEQDGAFGPFRAWREAAREPCRSCTYLSLCRGGCRVVSAHTLGDAALPDPECPRVMAHAAAGPTGLPAALQQERAPRRLPVVA